MSDHQLDYDDVFTNGVPDCQKTVNTLLIIGIAVRHVRSDSAYLSQVKAENMGEKCLLGLW